MAIAALSLLTRSFDAANAGHRFPVALAGLVTIYECWLGRNAAFLHLQ